MVGWTEMEDVRKVAECVPGVRWLDVGKKVGSADVGSSVTTLGLGPEREHRDLEREKDRDWNRSGMPPVTNPVEWANVLNEMPELEEMRGIRFFYEVPMSPLHQSAPSPFSSFHHSHLHGGGGRESPSTSSPGSSFSASSTTTTTISSLPCPLPMLSAAEQSRMKKNDEIASMLVWKCPKLRRVDHWQEGMGKVVLLGQDKLNAGMSNASGEGKQGKVRWGIGRVRI